MKIRYSWVMMLAPAPFLYVGLLFVPLRYPDLDYTAATFAYFALLPLGISLVFGWPLLLFPGAEVHPDRLRVKGRGWGPWKVLRPGEQFVIYRKAIHVRRVDGSMERTRVARWSCARRDWKRLRQWLPSVDAPQ